MLLMQSVQDDTMPVEGFEHHTFMCSSCHDVEQRLVFAKHDEQESAPREPSAVEQTSAAGQTGAEGVLEYTAVPLAARQAERPPAAGVLRRVLAKWRGG
jgi:hypothetical protein